MKEKETQRSTGLRDAKAIQRPELIRVFKTLPKSPRNIARNKELAEIWKETCRTMVEMRTLTNKTIHLVETYVYAVRIMRQVMTDKRATLTMKISALNTVRRCADSIGLNIAEPNKGRYTKETATAPAVAEAPDENEKIRNVDDMVA